MKSLSRTIITLGLLLWGTVVFANPYSIRILHVNDFHGNGEPIALPGKNDTIGGAVPLARRISELRAEKPTLVLAAGDMIQGDTWANLGKGEAVIKLMNAIGFTAMVTGNHEYDFGVPTLEERIAQAGFPLLAANVAGLPGVQPYIITVTGGARVAVVGLVTDSTPTTSHPKNTVGLIFSSPITTLKALLPELKSRADLVVVLAHLGHSVELELAKAFPEGLVVVGGHSHTRVEKPVRVGESVVVQAWEHGKTLGVLDLIIDNGKIVDVDGRLEEIRPSQGKDDSIVSGIVAKYSAVVAERLGAEVTVAEDDMSVDKVRYSENSLASLVADIIREESSADAALINAGSIRAGLKSGTVTMKDIYKMLPFNNYIISIRMTGRQLRQAIEHGLSAVEQMEGRFPQISGMEIVWNREALPHQRVKEITVKGAKLVDDRVYTVATLDFLAAGGDGYITFGEAIRAGNDFTEVGGTLQGSRIAYNNPGRWVRDVVMERLSRKKLLSAPVGGRIWEFR